MSDYKAYWTNIATKGTQWKNSIHHTMTKDDSVLKKSWEAFSTRWNQNKNFRWSVIATLLLLLISIFWDNSPTEFTGDANYVCQSPKIIHHWHITAFRPKWFGMFGGPGPITYKTNGRKGHRVSIVDIDRRDIEIEMWVDDKDFGYRPVEVDSTINCGDDLVRCLNMGFAAAMITIPPGKHIAKAQILDSKGTFRWDDERRRRVWWMVEECSEVE